MHKKKMLIIIVITIITIMVLEYANKKTNNLIKNYNTILSSNLNNEKQEITIYDIEDGFLKVSYNPKAEKNKYNLDKYLKKNKNFYSYEDENYKSKFGIDVSLYQGDIEWKKVKNAGINFAILRLGFRGYGQDGKIVLDSKFEENYNNAINEGIEIGVYFFSQATNLEEAQEEAKFVLKNIKDKEIKYPVIFDLEKIKYDVARTDNLNVNEITNITLEFCKEIEKNGYEPCIYGNAKTFSTKLKLEEFNGYKKWYADYQEIPIYPYEFNIWQYTESGNVDGINGNVDLNICFLEK